jgi:hypothetical protein
MGFELTTLVVIDTDCIGSCKSNYHTITSINTIVTDIEGNIRIYRLPSGRGTDHEIDISLASSVYITLCHGRDCMVVGFTTTYAISVYHH